MKIEVYEEGAYIVGAVTKKQRAYIKVFVDGEPHRVFMSVSQLIRIRNDLNKAIEYTLMNYESKEDFNKWAYNEEGGDKRK